MSSKLDQSLDEITKASRANTRNNARNNTNTRRNNNKPRVSTGGVTKKAAQKPTKPTKAAIHAPRPTQESGESKILVSNLPKDIKEAQIKEYFSQTIGPIKQALVTYDSNGNSLGIANVIFKRGDSAAKAVKELNGILVDKRPMKIEVILSAQPKPLSERIALPKHNQPKKEAQKSKPKPKATPKSAAAAPKAAGRRGKSNRPATKTVEQLDAEMSEYFEPAAGNGDGAAANTSAAAPTATNGDDAMIDSIM